MLLRRQLKFSFKIKHSLPNKTKRQTRKDAPPTQAPDLTSHTILPQPLVLS